MLFSKSYEYISYGVKGLCVVCIFSTTDRSWARLSRVPKNCEVLLLLSPPKKAAGKRRIYFELDWPVTIVRPLITWQCKRIRLCSACRCFWPITARLRVVLSKVALGALRSNQRNPPYFI